MHLDSGMDDLEVLATELEVLVTDLAGWCHTHALEADVGIVAMLLELRLQHLDRELSAWNLDDLEALLLDVVPSSLSLTAAEAAAAIDSIAVFLAFLEREGRLDPDSADLDELWTWLDRWRPQLLAEMTDPRLGTTNPERSDPLPHGPDGDAQRVSDTRPQAATSRRDTALPQALKLPGDAVPGAEVRPEDMASLSAVEQRALAALTGSCSHLAPRLLPSDEELEARAAGTATWQRLRTLLDHLATGSITVDSIHVPVEPDATALLAALRAAEDPAWQHPASLVQGAVIDEVDVLLLCDLAVVLGLVTVVGDELRVVDGGRARLAAGHRGLWLALVTAALRIGPVLQRWLLTVPGGVDGSEATSGAGSGTGASSRTGAGTFGGFLDMHGIGEPLDEPWWVHTLDRHAEELLAELEEAEVPVPIRDLHTLVLSHPNIVDDPPEPTEQRRILDALRHLLVNMADLGLLAVASAGDGDGTNTGELTVATTDLARWFLHHHAGLPVRPAGWLAGESAGALLDAVGELSFAAARAELRRWLDVRDQADALEELAMAARGDRRRMLAALLAFDSTAEGRAVPAATALLDDEVCGPFARAWLLNHGAFAAGVEDKGASLTLVFGALATLAERAGAEALLRGLARLGDHDAQLALVTDAWRCPTSETDLVLSIVVEVGPHARIREAAKRSLSKLRTARRRGDAQAQTQTG